jgi:Zn-dependent peptidase ImmA (M78 family)
MIDDNENSFFNRTLIKIAGIYYIIQHKTTEEMGGLVGYADFNKQVICINSDHTEQTRKIATYHEIIHIISEAYGLNLSEEQVKIGTHALLAFLRENEIQT